MRINLNADLGESFGPWKMGDDHRLLGAVDSANVACAFHAGDPLVMQRTVLDALVQGVSVGAHPGFPDLQGFGRRALYMPADEMAAAVLYQLAALDGICRANGHRMTHVKPHGAMNNLACDDRAMADTLVSAIVKFNSKLILVAPALSQLASAGAIAGLQTALEIFADRTYTDTGSLVSRKQSDAVIDNTNDCISHVLSMIDAGGIVTCTGTILKTPFHSVCVHGDNAHAVDTAIALRSALLAAQHRLLPLPELMRI